MTSMLNVYIGNAMTGKPFFNAPWFDEAEVTLLALHRVRSVFNPAAHDRSRGFDPMKCPNGSVEESADAGFELRSALGTDWCWIADNSDCMVVGPDWRTSKGTFSEIACHQALVLPVYEYGPFVQALRLGDELPSPLPSLMTGMKQDAPAARRQRMEPLALETRVRYHGSITEAARSSIGFVVCAVGEESPDLDDADRSTDGKRYAIYSPDLDLDDYYGYLWNVRRQSLTPIEG